MFTSQIDSSEFTAYSSAIFARQLSCTKNEGLQAGLVQDFGMQIQGVFKDYSRTKTKIVKAF